MLGERVACGRADCPDVVVVDSRDTAVSVFDGLATRCPGRAVPVQRQRLAAVLTDCPHVVRRDHVDAQQLVVTARAVRRGDLRPGAAVPVQDVGTADATTGRVADRPHVVGSGCGHAVEALERAGVRVIDQAPLGAVPVHDQRVPVAVAADRPDVIRCDGIDGQELRAELAFADVRRRRDAPGRAVEVLDERFVAQVERAVADRPDVVRASARPRRRAGCRRCRRSASARDPTPEVRSRQAPSPQSLRAGPRGLPVPQLRSASSRQRRRGWRRR